MTTYWDVESGPQSDEQLAKVKPEFKANRTLKDPDKIKADLAAKEQAWKDDAALDAKYGQVLCIGLLDDDGVRFLTGPEPDILKAFWDVFEEGNRMVGFNIKGWDLPFICQRSWILGVPVPKDLWEGRWWNGRFVDVLERWCCFSNRFEGNSLAAVAKATGVGEKTGDGKEFGKLFSDNQQAALDYCGIDLELTAKIAAKLGIA
jgi:hypothetical protein